MYLEYEDYVKNEMVQNPSLFLKDEKALELSYNLSRSEIPMSIITIVITFLYFCIFQYYTEGKTVGKLLLKLKLISDDGKRVSMAQLILRSSIINSLITSIIIILVTLTMDKYGFNRIGTIVQLVDYGIIIGSYICILCRKDNKGLHDIVAHTKVIDLTKEEKNENRNSK